MAGELAPELLDGDAQDLGQVLDVLLAGGRLAVEQRGDGNLLAAELLRNGLEREVLRLLRLKQSRG